ncbi:hypothetical protein KKC13_09945 [bacterium]|nr:hypothetical protein [bacterium]MBU1956948.1 hypothetical protein [bacterium]
MSLKKMLFIFFVLLTYLFGDSYNTSKYQKIEELKTWSKTVDIYFENYQEKHQCSDKNHKSRFLLTDVQNKSHHLSNLLMAFASGKKVKVYYKCNSNGYPEIAGVRTKH